MSPLPISPDRVEFTCPDCKALFVEYTARNSVFCLAVQAYEEELSNGGGSAERLRAHMEDARQALRMARLTYDTHRRTAHRDEPDDPAS